MQIITKTQDELVVTHREPPSRIIAVSLCLGFILLFPIVFPRLWPEMGKAPAGVELLFLGLFLITVVFAVIMFRCHETYSFSRARQAFLITRTGPFGTTSRTGKLADITEVFQESYDDNDAIKEFVIVVFSDGKKIRLPWRSLSFSAEERSELGAALAYFLRVPVRIDNY